MVPALVLTGHWQSPITGSTAQKGKKRHLCVEEGKETGLGEQLEISRNKPFFSTLSPHIENILFPQEDSPESHLVPNRAQRPEFLGDELPPP